MCWSGLFRIFSFCLGVATLNAFISDVDALNTSLLLAVQRLAKVTENSTQERNEEGEGSKKNTADQGSYGYFT